MKFRRHTTRWRLGGLTALTLVLALVMQLAFPFHAFSASPDLPRPGERLAAGRYEGITALLMDGHDGVRIVIQHPERLINVYRYEAIIRGDTLEFYGEAVLIYANGHRVYPVRELFADGERLTFFVDHTQGVNAELYVQFRRIVGAADATLYILAIAEDNTRRAGLSSADPISEAVGIGPPYSRTRPVGAGSVLDVMVPNPGSRMPLYTIAVARPNQPPAPEVTPSPTPPPTDPPVQPTPTPTPTPEPTPTPTPPVTQPLPPVVIRFVDGNTIYTINGTVTALDAAPFRTGGRFMVPLRAVAEALGASAEWVGGEHPVEIRTDTNVIQLAIDVALYDNDGAYMGTPVIVNSRTFVPLRFVAEHFAAEVRWDGDAQAAYVYRCNWASTTYAISA